VSTPLLPDVLELLQAVTGIWDIARFEHVVEQFPTVIFCKSFALAVVPPVTERCVYTGLGMDKGHASLGIAVFRWCVPPGNTLFWYVVAFDPNLRPLADELAVLLYPAQVFATWLEVRDLFLERL